MVESLLGPFRSVAFLYNIVSEWIVEGILWELLWTRKYGRLVGSVEVTLGRMKLHLFILFLVLFHVPRGFMPRRSHRGNREDEHPRVCVLGSVRRRRPIRGWQEGKPHYF